MALEEELAELSTEVEELDTREDIEDVVDLDEEAILLEDEAVDLVKLADTKELLTELPRIYSSRRLPAPQYSYAFPGQIKLQSVSGAETEPMLRVLPQ